MGIMENLFGRAPQNANQPRENMMTSHGKQQAPAANPNGPGGLGAGQNQNPQQQQNQPQNNAQTNQGMNNQAPGQNQNSGNSSPLDEFSNLWQPQKTDPNAVDSSTFKYPTMDMQKFSKGVSTYDPLRNVDQNLFQKAASGDGQALKDLLTNVGRNAFSDAFLAGDKYNSRMFDHYDQSVNARIPKQVKSLQSDAATMAAMQNMNHPAIAPMIETIGKQMQMMYPDASPQEIAENAKKYLMSVAQVIAKGSEQSGQGNSGPQGQVNNGSSPVGVVNDFSSWEV